jgi:hypothetical protein
VEEPAPAFDLDEPAAHAPEPPVSADHEVYAPAMSGGPARAEGADMAALLRELSSLGGGFDDAPAASEKVVTRPVDASTLEAKPTKKKKGFFGR